MIRWLNRRPASDIIRLAVVFLLGRATCHAEDWPQFRGPNHDGSSPETSLPEKFSKTENVKWVAPLPGPGASMAIVWGERVFVTAPEPAQRLLRAIDITTGKTLSGADAQTVFSVQ
mgnify:CR=1 FL=1